MLNKTEYNEAVINWSLNSSATLKTDALDKLPKRIKIMIANYLLDNLKTGIRIIK